MPNILNYSSLGSRVFTDFHPDSAETVEDDYHVEIPDVTSDSGGMNDQLANNATALRTAALSQKYKKSYQWNTKNTSFIELHEDLKKLGIKNNKFFLALYDKTLMDVDPFSIIMPLEVQARIFRECMINPWYFLREIARIPEDGKPIVAGGGTAFRIDRNSAATWYLWLNGIDHFSSKPRQCGKTQDALAKINYAYHFGSMSASITFGNKDSTLNKMNLARLKAQRDLMPLFLQMKISIDFDTMKINKGTENVTSMKNPITKNTITLLPTANTEARADGLGRGFTSSIQFWDEFEWMPFNTRIIDTCVFAYNTASDNAKKNNSLYGRIFTSTPGNLDSRDGQSADIFIRGDEVSKPMLNWKDSMFDMPINKLREIVTSKAYNGIVFVEHGWKELKKSNAWYEKACLGVRYNAEQIAREILLMRLRGTSKSPFKRTDIMALINGVSTPIGEIDYSDNCSPVVLYEELDRATRYIMAIDPAEGLSGDNMAMVLINPYTEKIAAEFKSPYIHQSKMAKMLVRFMDKYCPRSLIIVENNRGRELLHALQDTRYSGNLWYDVEKLEAKVMVNEDIDTRADRALGFNTSPKTRPLLYNLLETLVSEENEKVNAKYVVDDICALEKNPTTGRISAASGKHDDMVMAYLIGMYVFRTANNLEEWGIYRGMTPPKSMNDASPEAIAGKIKELASLLPPEMRKLFIREDKDPVSEAMKYAKQIHEQQAAYSEINKRRNDLLGIDDDEDDTYNQVFAGNESKMQEDRFDEDILNLNLYNKDDNFDINDFL
jgi:hypothetical protein